MDREAWRATVHGGDLATKQQCSNRHLKPPSTPTVFVVSFTKVHSATGSSACIKRHGVKLLFTQKSLLSPLELFAVRAHSRNSQVSAIGVWASAKQLTCIYSTAAVNFITDFVSLFALCTRKLVSSLWTITVSNERTLPLHFFLLKIFFFLFPIIYSNIVYCLNLGKLYQVLRGLRQNINKYEQNTGK